MEMNKSLNDLMEKKLVVKLLSEQLITQHRTTHEVLMISR